MMTTPTQEIVGRETPVLEAIDVSKHFVVHDQLGRHSTVRAVENANIALHRGEIVALVGESGSGKTTIARLLALSYPVSSGEIRLRGEPVGDTSKRVSKDYYKAVQLIFQDPFGALNSLHRSRYMLRRALELHGHAKTRAEAHQQSVDLLRKVNLVPPEDILEAFPHALSGGQRQRLVIARALAVRPDVLLADEPISMLDVSIRLDMLNLLDELRTSEGLAMLYITHDIASARYLADSVHVMYAGQSVEGGPTEEVIATPQHPYTQLLIESSPDPARSMLTRGSVFDAPGELGEPPSLADPPSGCRFRTRCTFAMDQCAESFPPRTEFPNGQWSHCWLHQAGKSDLLANPVDLAPDLTTPTESPNSAKETAL